MIALAEVNEKSSCVIQVMFSDEDGNEVTPDSGTYRIDDVLTGTAIKAVTAFIPESNAYDIHISSAENAIINSSEVYEKKLVTITWSKVAGAVLITGTGAYMYKVINLSKIS